MLALGSLGYRKGNGLPGCCGPKDGSDNKDTICLRQDSKRETGRLWYGGITSRGTESHFVGECLRKTHE